MATRASSKQKPTIKLNAGDTVLLGGTRASYPWHWYFGDVVWADGADVLVKRSTLNGETYCQHVSIFDVRARGTYSELSAIKDAAAKETRELTRAVEEREQELSRARDALWARLEEMAANGLKIIPPDFATAEAQERAACAIVERIDEEEAMAVA